MERQRHCGSQQRTTAGAALPGAPLSALRPPRLTEQTYHGRYGPHGAEVWVGEFRAAVRHRREAITVRPLPLHLEVRNHSPTGMALRQVLKLSCPASYGEEGEAQF